MSWHNVNVSKLPKMTKEEAAICDEGNPIMAIRMYRERTGKGLLESKVLIIDNYKYNGRKDLVERDNPMVSIQERFEAFDKAHPTVYEAFKKFAEEAIASGCRKIGAKFLAERIRWQVMVETQGEAFKLNNNYVSRYVRKLTNEFPTFRPYFELRGLKA